MTDTLSFSGRVGGERGTPHGSPMGTQPARPSCRRGGGANPTTRRDTRRPYPLPNLTKEATDGE